MKTPRLLLCLAASLVLFCTSGTVALADPTDKNDDSATSPKPPDAATVRLVDSSPVCVIDCDGGDAGDTVSDLVPVDEVSVGDTTLGLHVSLEESLGWAEVTGASEDDVLWIERSWDAGSTREQPLDPVSTENPDAATGTVNLSDPSNHRRGVVRACLDPADGSPSVCTDWAFEQVCDGDLCDGQPAPVDARAEQPVDPATSTNRRVELNIAADGRAWGELSRATEGDEVWIERSWDEGTSARDGKNLGRTEVDAGESSTRSTSYLTSDPGAKLYGGSVRACLRVQSAQSTACTDWARPSQDRARSAADALMYDYDPYDAWWPSSWWNSAVATHTIIDYQDQTGDDTYAWVIDRTFEVNRHPFPAGEKSTDEIEGNFLSRAIDDAGWWGLAWVSAYDLTGDDKYLDMAEIIGDYMYDYWDEDLCGGGVYWDGEKTYKNAVTNGQFIRLSAALHNRTGDPSWLDRSTTAWDWYMDSGMVGDDGLVQDGLDSDTCEGNGQTVWTYNQGLPIGAGVELYKATGDTAYLDTARDLADATFDSDELTPDGILTESCEDPDGEQGCDDNQKQFKGIYMRYLDELDEVTGGEYRDVIDDQADAAYGPGRDAMSRIGVRWSGESVPGSPNSRDWRTQASGLSAILAAS